MLEKRAPTLKHIMLILSSWDGSMTFKASCINHFLRSCEIDDTMANL